MFAAENDMARTRTNGNATDHASKARTRGPSPTGARHTSLGATPPLVFQKNVDASSLLFGETELSLVG